MKTVKFVRYISPESHFKLEYIPGDDGLNSESEVADTVRTLALIPFNLEEGPLMVARLFHLETRRYILYINMHHIICDGWSMDIVFRELFMTYNDLVSGASSHLEPLPVTYKDFAVWQRDRLNHGFMEVHRDYWLHRFSGGNPGTGFPVGISAPLPGRPTTARLLRETFRPEPPRPYAA